MWAWKKPGGHFDHEIQRQVMAFHAPAPRAGSGRLAEDREVISFRVAVAGKEGLQPTRMEFRHFTGPMKGRTVRGQPGVYYSVDNYHLTNGLRAALP